MFSMYAGVVGEGRYIAVMNVVMQESRNSIVKLREDTGRPKKAGMPIKRQNVGDDFIVMKKTWLMLLQHLPFLMIISIQIDFQ